MKNRIYDSSAFRCVLDSDSYKIKEINSYTSEVFFPETDKPQLITFHLEGDAYFVWGNRAGEGFFLNCVFKRLVELNYQDSGLSISYPATASMTAFLIRVSNEKGFLCFMDNDNEGRIGEIRIKSDDPQRVALEVNSIQKKWTILQFDAVHPLSNYLGNKLVQSAEYRKNFQLGLIDPSGQTNVPLSRGFDIIYDVAQVLLKKYGKVNNIIHIFAYGRGHDNYYPDYSPSELLGGKDMLKRTLKKVKDLGFVISCYLNARIIDREALSIFPQLKKSILKDSEGHYLEEVYQERTFYVMDPSSSDWQKCLIGWARTLYDCGADAVQLDQIGGRAAAKNIGEVWGDGYNHMISEIHDIGLKVWIQGISDLYDADWFEMTYRDLNILEGGIIRGGNPFGDLDLSLISLFLSDKTFLIPVSELKKIKNHDHLEFIEDYPDYRGELPLYSNEYMKRLINAEAALR